MTIHRISDWMTNAVRAMGALGGACVIILTLLTSLDAVLRYVFNAPLIWAYDISTYLMGVCVFFGIPHTELENGHVNVDVFFMKLSERGRLLANAVLRLIMFAVCLVMTWAGLSRTLMAFRDNAATVGVVRIPKYPIEIAFFISMLLFTVFLVFKIYGYLAKLAGNESSALQPSPPFDAGAKYEEAMLDLEA